MKTSLPEPRAFTAAARQALRRPEQAKPPEQAQPPTKQPHPPKQATMALSIRNSTFRVRLNIERQDTAGTGSDHPFRGQNCTVVYTDVVGFAGRQRTERDRLAIRRALAAITATALAPFWNVCVWADRGDGMLIIVPPGVPTSAVLECLTQNLPVCLHEHNQQNDPAGRIQLRVAVDVGPVVTDHVGVSGNPIILAARMLEAPALKRAITAAQSPLAVIASAFVFNTAVSSGDESLAANDYTPVQVRVKETRVSAWLRLTDLPGDGQARAG